MLSTESVNDSIRQLSALLEDLPKRYSIDPARLFLGGFSTGAAMAGAMLLLHPEEVAGAAVVSGFLPPDPHGRYRAFDVAGKPVFLGHGTMDPVVPLSAAHQTRDFLRKTPVDLLHKEYPIGRQMSSDELQDLMRWLDRALARACGSAQISLRRDPQGAGFNLRARGGHGHSCYE